MASDQTNNKPFGQPHIIPSRSTHTHTAIVLHGRGCSADEFADDFLASTLSDGRSVCDALPGWRWVFPCSKELWSTAFQEAMPAWFEAHSLTDPTTRQDLQVDGLRDAVDHVSHIIDDEVAGLAGASQRLVLGGISQGGAVAMWSMLCQRDESKPLGAFFAASTWLPFAAEVGEYLTGSERRPSGEANEVDMASPGAAAVRLLPSEGCPEYCKSIPVFLGHGTDDAYVDIELGREAADILRRGGWKVEWQEYTGAEEEGHWFKVPDEMDDVYTFLLRFSSHHG